MFHQRRSVDSKEISPSVGDRIHSLIQSPFIVLIIHQNLKLRASTKICGIVHRVHLMNGKKRNPAHPTPPNKHVRPFM